MILVVYPYTKSSNFTVKWDSKVLRAYNECDFIKRWLWVSRKPKEPCSRIRLLCHFCTSNWASPSKSWPLRLWAQPWLSDLGFIGCLMGLYSSISLSNTGPQTIQASTPLPPLLLVFPFFPFVKLASCALMISSVSAFVPFELCFFLAFPLSFFLFVCLFFFHLFSFLLSLSGLVQVDCVLENLLGSRACGSPTCWSSAHSHANCPVLSMLLFPSVSGCVSIRSLVQYTAQRFMITIFPVLWNVRSLEIPIMHHKNQSESADSRNVATWYQKNICHCMLYSSFNAQYCNLVTGYWVISVPIVTGSRLLLIPNFVFTIYWFLF